jgi:hypothetical protein
MWSRRIIISNAEVVHCLPPCNDYFRLRAIASTCVAARAPPCDVLGMRWVRAAAAWGALLFASSCGGRSPLELGVVPPPDAPNQPAQAPTAAGGTTQVTPTPTPPPATLPMRPASPACESANIDVAQLRPAVTLLVDQSGSMSAGYPERESPQTRWSIVQQALLDPTRGVVKSLEQSMQFGLAFYTSRNGFSGGECPILSEVRSATGNYESIRALYDNTYPDDDTPTGAAISQIVKEIQATNRKGPQVILLVTDGEPDTCEVPDPQDGQLEAIQAALLAHAAGVEVYVLGVSSDISGEKLQQLANAGQGKPIAAVWGTDADAALPYQASNDVAGLTAQLREILARVPLCQVELERDVSREEARRGKVQLDGQRLVYQAADGFQLTDPRHLQIVGKACETLRAAGKRLTVRISCE